MTQPYFYMFSESVFIRIRCQFSVIVHLLFNFHSLLFCPIFQSPSLPFSLLTLSFSPPSLFPLQSLVFSFCPLPFTIYLCPSVCFPPSFPLFVFPYVTIPIFLPYVSPPLSFLCLSIFGFTLCQCPHLPPLSLPLCGKNALIKRLFHALFEKKNALVHPACEWYRLNYVIRHSK